MFLENVVNQATHEELRPEVMMPTPQLGEAHMLYLSQTMKDCVQ